ncbi:MAG: hypothetical protein HIU82_11995 [Proteobacteria bacterium]|jgi:hypothetical protein|nr:hypothetical protein [Pseudomonadota bacterium]
MFERLTEVGLFLLPFAAFLALRLAAARGWPSGFVLGWAGGALLVLLVGLFWFAQAHRLPPDATYVPARVSDGRIRPGYGSP